MDSEEAGDFEVVPQPVQKERSSVCADFEPSDSAKRKWEAYDFDAEMNMASSSAVPVSTGLEFDTAVRNSWNDCVRDAARSIISKPLIFPWEQGLAAEILGNRKWMPFDNNMPFSHNPFALY